MANSAMLDFVIEQLKPYDRVIVTGPNRSGTHIASRIIASGLGLKWLTEQIYNYDNQEVCRKVLGEKRICLQGVAMFFWIDTLKKDHPDEQLAVVCMLRNGAEIVASQNRIQWPGEAAEVSKVGGSPSYLHKHQRWIDRYMAEPHMFTLHYRDLAGHKLFKTAEQRKGWKFDQTE